MPPRIPLSLTEAKSFYFDLITTIVPGPASYSYFIPLLLLPLGLLIPPNVRSHTQLSALIVPVSLAATAHAWFALGGTDVILADSVYMTLFLYVFKDPRRDFRRVVRRGDEEKDEKVDGKDDVKEEAIMLESYPGSFKDRLYWAAVLPQARPMHDWVIGNPSHDKRAVRPFHHPNRLYFALDVLSRLIPVIIIFLPLSIQLALHDPLFTSPSQPMSPFTFLKAFLLTPYSPSAIPSHTSPTINLFQTLIPAPLGRPLTIALYTYSLLLTLFLPPMLFALLLNALHIIPDAWSPHTWRPHFGPFSSILKFGVRGFWGQWWHQQMRHIVSEPGRFVARKLHLGDEGWERRAKYMLICTSAFVLSGITHAGLVPPCPRWAVDEAWVLRVWLAGFFWIQPLGITLEMGVVEPVLGWVRGVLGTKGAEVLRMVWTAAWMCASCVLLVRPFGQLGYWGVVPEYRSLI